MVYKSVVDAGPDETETLVLRRRAIRESTVLVVCISIREPVVVGIIQARQ